MDIISDQTLTKCLENNAIKWVKNNRFQDQALIHVDDFKTELLTKINNEG